MTGENFELATPLGAWDNVSHRSWEWVLSDGGDVLFQKAAKGWAMHVRQNEVWVREGITVVAPKGKAASVRITGAGRIVLRSSAAWCLR